ncbi:MAG: hypothetical protein LBH76_00995 [Propionibacteriaceae bacterium]|jgi:hypothetical protein|nr:hypothetical protein [Propionibacteriaceae bacterium]
MLGVYDFNGHYDWTFAWLEARGGEALLNDYWTTAISRDSQAHARELFRDGFDGMTAYWGHTLAEEGAGYTSGVLRHPGTGRELLRIDMRACPSQGFLLRNGVKHSRDYCRHCVGWIGPSLRDAGYEVDHEHDHAAHCWWEIRAADDPTPASSAGELTPDDVRLMPSWEASAVDAYRRSAGPLPVSPADQTDAPPGRCRPWVQTVAE